MSSLLSFCQTRPSLGPAGDEITFDYATTEDHDQAWTCACNTATCRGHITGEDWRRPELQERYDGRFMSHIQRKIDVLDPAAALARKALRMKELIKLEGTLLLGS